MAEKLLEEVIALDSLQDPELEKWLLEKLTNTSACSIEDFAVFYLNLIKNQTDDFIKNNTSTCNTPRKPSIANINDSVNEFISKYQCSESVASNFDENRVKRQSSRELFVKHDMKSLPLIDSEAQQIPSPSQFIHRNATIKSSTPVASFTRNNLSTDLLPSNTSTPNSSRNTTKNSISFQSPMNARNSSRKSLDLSSKNNSRRNTNNSLCLGDFLNTSTNSSSGKGGKRRNTSHQSSILEITPKFSNTDFPSLSETSPNEAKSQPKKAENKPKKRVVPITISRQTTPGPTTFTSSSFQSENNLSNLTATESMEFGDMRSEMRKMFNQREAISKDFTESEPQKNLHAIVRASLPSATQLTDTPRKPSTLQFDESRVERKEILTKMAKVYSILLDLNMVPNILSEYSYLFNILNTDHEPLDQLTLQNQNLTKSFTESVSMILKSSHNCIYFIVKVLSYQKSNLALLDVMTLRVLIDNERVQQLAKDLHDHIRIAIKQKSQLDTLNKTNSNNDNSIGKVVFYQQETDNRDNFPSEREFGAFKKQRDLFYTILRSWELKHLDQAYDFSRDLGSKIRSLISTMEHPINMAHLARLFTSQLIISCNFDNSANELQMVLPNIDLSKLSKLRQRLVAPSQFSTQYLFPGNQAFFRDFIICCDNYMMFMEQLKISLISELMQMNNSSIDTLCITPTNNDEKNVKEVKEEFIVRAETMTTMRVLAKFIGFVVSRPFSFDGYRNTLVDQKQSEIRNLVRKCKIFNFRKIL